MTKSSGMFAVGRPEGLMKPGDVLRYAPERHHCREATAFVDKHGRAVDTFWGPYGDGESHFLTAEELKTAEPVFNVADFDALDRYSRASLGMWETYHPRDRGRISSQHGLQEALFIRKGAQPDLETQIGNARAKVEAAESKLRSAGYGLESAQKDLAELEARRA